MKRIVLTLALACFLVFSFGLIASAEMAKKGTTSGKTYYTGTFTRLPMGKERVQLNYEACGVRVSDTGSGLFHNASVYVLGALHAVKGEYKDSGMIVVTCSSGDKAFLTYEGAGKLAGTAQGTITYVGGTGRLVGITGSGEFTRTMLRPPKEGMFASLSITKATWELPAAKK